jgi:hypothetical protein
MHQSNVKHNRKNCNDSHYRGYHVKQKKKRCQYNEDCYFRNCRREHTNGMNRKGITNKQKKKNCRFNENCYDPNCRREHTNGMNRKGITRSNNYHKKYLLKANDVINKINLKLGKKNKDLKEHNLNYETIISQQFKDNDRLYKENITVVRYCCDLKSLNNKQKNEIDINKEEIEHFNLLVDDIVVGKEINYSKCMICYSSLTVETIYNGEEQECNCTMNVHKFCLHKVKILNNMSCIICRKQIYEEIYIPPPPPPYGAPPPLIDLTEDPSDGESVEEQYAPHPPPNPPPTQLSSPHSSSVRNLVYYPARDIGIELIRPALYTPPIYVIQPSVSPQNNGATDL